MRLSCQWGVPPRGVSVSFEPGGLGRRLRVAADGWHDKRALLTMSTKTPDEITQYLAAPDVAVTNQKDKQTMLPIVGKTNEHVREMMSGMHRR